MGAPVGVGLLLNLTMRWQDSNYKREKPKMGFSNFFTSLIGSPLNDPSKVWREIKKFEVRGIFSPLFLGEFVKNAKAAVFLHVKLRMKFFPSDRSLKTCNLGLRCKILKNEKKSKIKKSKRAHRENAR